MKTKLIMTFLLLIISIGFIICYSQNNIYFDYDESGNRIYRGLVMPEKKSTSDKNSEEREEFKDQVNGKDIFIYPNPVTSELIIKIPSLKDDEFASLSLYDQNGRLIYRNDHATVSNKMSLADQLQGIYFLNIQIDESIIQWKIIKE